ncbi:MAG: hypothetical protein ACREJQ_04695 [bacterium]
MMRRRNPLYSGIRHAPPPHPLSRRLLKQLRTARLRPFHFQSLAASLLHLQDLALSIDAADTRPRPLNIRFTDDLPPPKSAPSAESADKATPKIPNLPPIP